MPDTQSYDPPKKLDDPDIRLAEIALKRAALKARERAISNGQKTNLRRIGTKG